MDLNNLECKERRQLTRVDTGNPKKFQVIRNMKLLVVLFRADGGGRRHQGERAFKLLQNGEVQNGLNPVILPKKAVPQHA